MQNSDIQFIGEHEIMSDVSTDHVEGDVILVNICLSDSLHLGQ